MATYVIGDVQGCFVTLQRLLTMVGFGPADQLWLAGDVVNRGPRSAKLVRWCMAREDRVTLVLGNHDLHLLGRHYGVRKAARRDTLEKILDAKDRVAMVDWLRRQPLLHRSGEFVLVHAGLHPAWSVDEAAERAAAIEAALRAPNPKAFLAGLARGEGPSADVSALTRIRTVDAVTGEPRYGFAGAPLDAPEGQVPWFEHPDRRSRDHTILFGHWAALGLRRAPGIWALDSGCVWGQRLTALRLEDGAVFQTPYADG